MNCRVCNSALDNSGYCSNCGFDEGLALEYYPTLDRVDDLPSVSTHKNLLTAQNNNQHSINLPPSPSTASQVSPSYGIWLFIALAVLLLLTCEYYLCIR